MITGEPLPTTATPNSQVSIPEHWPTTPKIITRSNPLLHIHTQLKTGLYHILMEYQRKSAVANMELKYGGHRSIDLEPP